MYMLCSEPKRWMLQFFLHNYFKHFTQAAQFINKKYQNVTISEKEFYKTISFHIVCCAVQDTTICNRIYWTPENLFGKQSDSYMYSAKLSSSKVVYAMYKVVLAFEYIERTSKMLSNEFFGKQFCWGCVNIPFPSLDHKLAIVFRCPHEDKRYVTLLNKLFSSISIHKMVISCL